jgi:hypothetical protein
VVQTIPRTCAWCGSMFEQVKRATGGGRPAKYCSVEHRIKANNRRPGRDIAGPRCWPRSVPVAKEICDLYRSGLSAGDVARKFGKNAETISRVLRANGVALRDRNAPTAAKCYKDGKIKLHGGYVGILLRPGDPLYSMVARSPASMKLGGYAPEHRIVVARALGRPLERFENVHHKNGIRDDNRPENLELWTKPQPIGQRPEDLVSWVVFHYPELVDAELRMRKREKHSGQVRLVI